MSILGYQAIHHCPERIDLQNPDRNGFREYDDVDFVADAPAVCFYRRICDAYPDCKTWILTIRDIDTWMRSALWHYQQHKQFDDPAQWKLTQELMVLLFGTQRGEPFYVRRAYQMHNDMVRYEAQRRGVRLLELNISAGEGWDKLCPFLDKPIPSEPFPWDNRGVTPRS
jgi:hypothetical protein